MTAFAIIVLSLGIVANSVSNHMNTRWLSELSREVSDLHDAVREMRR